MFRLSIISALILRLGTVNKHTIQYNEFSLEILIHFFPIPAHFLGTKLHARDMNVPTARYNITSKRYEMYLLQEMNRSKPGFSTKKAVLTCPCSPKDTM